MTETGFARKRFQLAHDHPHQRGLPFAVATDQRHLFSPLDLNVRMTEHDLLRITDFQVRRLENNVSGTRCRGKLDRQGRMVRLIHLDPVQFLQRLDPGLDLVGLGRLVSEPRDEFFRLVDHPLLVLVGGDLLGHPFCTENDILAVRHLVVMDMPQHDLDGTVGHVIQEAPVMGHQHQRPAEPFEVTLQPFDGFDVQMVGGLVKEQDIRPGEQDFRQFDPHVPTLTEGFGRTIEITVPES